MGITLTEYLWNMCITQMSSCQMGHDIDVLSGFLQNETGKHQNNGMSLTKDKDSLYSPHYTLLSASQHHRNLIPTRLVLDTMYCNVPYYSLQQPY